MKIDCGPRSLTVRLILLLVIGHGLPMLSAKVTYAEDEKALVVAAADKADPGANPAIPEKQPTKADPASTTAMADSSAASGEDFDSDPLESFNEKMFWFNREILDRFILKPAATAWDFVLPDPVQKGIHNVFDNLAVVRRVVNNALQLKFTGAAKEVARFTINSTIGVAGFFDVAKEGFGLEQNDQDMGLTFGVWGMGPGPFLILPFLPPLTVRDGIGYAIDAAMTPYIYFHSLVCQYRW